MTEIHVIKIHRTELIHLHEGKFTLRKYIKHAWADDSFNNIRPKQSLRLPYALGQLDDAGQVAGTCSAVASYHRGGNPYVH